MLALVTDRGFSSAPGAVLFPGRVVVQGPRIPFGRRSATVLGRVGGLGVTSDQIASTIYGAGSPIGAAAAAPAVASALGISASLAVPLLGAAFFGVFEGIELILHSGCGQTCVVTSQWANQAGDLMTQNLNAWLALPAPRSRTAQLAYLANFDALWNKLKQLCGQTGTGDAGVRCITDRQAGACKWHAATAGGWNRGPDGMWAYTGYGPATDSGGVCWNWFIGLRDPIANDPTVVDDAAAASAAGAHESLISAGLLPGVSGVSSSSLVLFGLGALALWAVFS